MKPGGGPRKGSAFERKICKKFSLWVSDGERTDIFWRSAMSGGRAVLLLKSGLRAPAQAGDMSAIDALGFPFLSTFIVEMKSYKDLLFHGLLTATRLKSSLLDFWIKLCDDAYKFDRFPILIAKQNRIPILICLNEKGKDAFILGWDEMDKKGKCNRRFLRKPNLVFPSAKMNIYLFDEFLKNVSPEALNLL